MPLLDTKRLGGRHACSAGMSCGVAWTAFLTDYLTVQPFEQVMELMPDHIQGLQRNAIYYHTMLRCGLADSGATDHGRGPPGRPTAVWNIQTSSRHLIALLLFVT